LGKAKAHHCVEVWSQAVVRDNRHLRDVAADALRSDPELAPSLGLPELDALFDADAAARPAVLAARHQMDALQATWAMPVAQHAADSNPRNGHRGTQ
jgi:hypothetical protein